MIYRFYNNSARDLLKGNRNQDEGNRKKRKFEGKIIVITGASSGIGRQAALDFVNEDASSIILIARSESKLLELKRTLHVDEPKSADIVTFPCDVSKKEGVLRMGTQILEKFGHIDLLINNAGFGEFGKVENESIERIEAVMRTNYFGMVYCTKVFLQSMLWRYSGHIVNVASLAASFGVPGLAGYCVSKYAMLVFSESLDPLRNY